MPYNMKRINVLILITKSNWGGAQRHVFDLASMLPRDTYDVEVMAGGNGPLISRLIEAGVKADGNLPIGRDINLLQDIAAFFKLIGAIRSRNPDVLHLHSSKIGVLGALAGRLAGVPRVVFTCHGWAFNEDRSVLSKTLIRLAYWITMFLCHSVVAVSETVRNQVAHWPVVPKKISVVYNGIAPGTHFSRTNARFELAKMAPRIKGAIADIPESRQVWIGTVAELHPIKGHEYALRALRMHLDQAAHSKRETRTIYVVIGAGQEADHLAALAIQLGLEEHVFFLGHVDDAYQYLKAFDIFLLPSLSEALAYVLLEAGLAQTAVVATAVGGIPEVVEDMQSGVLVQPRNERELAHAISFMIEHPTERKKYGAALRERVLERFSLDEMIEKIQEVYRG